MNAVNGTGVLLTCLVVSCSGASGGTSHSGIVGCRLVPWSWIYGTMYNGTRMHIIVNSIG